MKTKTILLTFLLAIVAATGMADNKKFTLVIDAGHGGHDAGALGHLTKEKHINLNVALAFGKLIEQNCSDVKVIYTRKTDVFIPLQERANIANRNGADLFISIHTNAVPAGRITRGFETYTLGMHRAKDNLDVAMRENSVISMETDYKQRYQGFDPKSSESYIMFEFIQSNNMEKSVELAKCIQRNVCATAGRTNKGVHQAGFLVLRATSMPSCLVELGFITTPDEEEFLHSQSGVDAMARGLYKAFVEYKNKFSDKIVVPNKIPESQGLSAGQVIPQPDIKPTAITTKQPATPAAKPTAKPAAKTTTGKQPADKPVATKTQEKPATAKTQDKPAATKTQDKPATAKAQEKPVFKVQIFASNRTLRPGSEQFKGHKNVDYYKDGVTVKYTMGASTDYDEIAKLRKSLQADFPEAFIVAFRNGERMDTNQAISEYRASKKK